MANNPEEERAEDSPDEEEEKFLEEDGPSPPVSGGSMAEDDGDDEKKVSGDDDELEEVDEDKGSFQPLRFEPNDLAMCLDFYPDKANRTLAVGHANGKVSVHRVGESGEAPPTALHEFSYHRAGLREVSFCPTPGKLVTLGRDKVLGLVDLEAGRLVNTLERSHEAHPSAIEWYNASLFATGDDDGVIRIWDIRSGLGAQGRPVLKMNDKHSEYIADFQGNEDKKSLVSVGGDGHLGVWDIRKGTLVAMSDNLEEELLSVALVRGGSKAAVGTATGTISLFSWGDWGDCNDRFPALSDSVDRMVALDSSTLVTGSGDGQIRVLSVFPHAVVADIGRHSTSSVSSLSVVGGDLVATGTLENVVRFWDLSEALGKRPDPEDSEDEDSEEEESSTDEETGSRKRKRRKKIRRASAGMPSAKRQKFFDGLS